MNRRILLIEDSPQVAESVRISLHSEGCAVTCAPSLEAARKFAPFTGFDLALVDVMLPDGSGLEFCAELRLANPSLPIVIVTAKADEDSVVAGLHIANDYIRKPFGKRELVARIQKCLSLPVKTAKVISFEGLSLHPTESEARSEGHVAKLRPKEFSILSILTLSGGEVVSRERILDLVDREHAMFDRSLDAHLSRIRKALTQAGIRHFELASAPGKGYLLRKKKAA